LRKDIGKNARLRAEDFFSFDEMMRRYISVYREMVALKRKNG
jgi:glycosyltransferase involved in cell wall biosynthesis